MRKNQKEFLQIVVSQTFCCQRVWYFLWNLFPWSQKYYLIDCVCMYCVFCERFFFFFCEMVRVICCLCWIIQNNSLNWAFSIFLFSKAILSPFLIEYIAGCSLDFRYTMFVHTRVYIYIGFACIWCPWLVRSIVSLLSLFTLGVLCLHFPRDYSYSRSSKLFCLLFGDSTHTILFLSSPDFNRRFVLVSSIVTKMCKPFHWHLKL